MGKPEWKTDPRFTNNNQRVKNRKKLESLIEKVTQEKTTQEWLDVFYESGMPYAAVNDIQGTLNHEHGKPKPILLINLNANCNVVQARNMVKEVEHPVCGPMKLVNTPVKYSHSTPSIRTPPPMLGQHTDEVLREILGMSEAEIKSLRQEGAVA